jgi:hypothetical protein
MPIRNDAVAARRLETTVALNRENIIGLTLIAQTPDGHCPAQTTGERSQDIARTRPGGKTRNQGGRVLVAAKEHDECCQKRTTPG